ncbi:double-stranded RNA-binding domain(DsRBD)-containing protein [Striga asiatica]|uniref:Double-stranded RNA-binding domain(DsRBD)-containing protein n=1 Tax=Striga asiatica TaxID=4170 RepID=A0A5A7P0Y0_STRAF|nr:double-stranded RNA-binding domain(DsRBD)-containing protein [Striga asiatica]
MCRLIIEKLVEPQQPLKNLSIVESSSSRQESPHKPSLSKQVEQHSEQQIVETPAQVDMDYTKTEIIVTNPHLPQKALILARDDSSTKQIDTSASKLKTWKRVGNKEGRLQRKQQISTHITHRDVHREPSTGNRGKRRGSEKRSNKRTRVYDDHERKKIRFEDDKKEKAMRWDTIGSVKNKVVKYTSTDCEFPIVKLNRPPITYTRPSNPHAK